jgi:cystathionine gamma-synthase/methionine-gamma-lyase
MRVLSVVHTPLARAEVFADVARDHGHELVEWDIRQHGAPVPEADAVFVFGGYENVGEEREHPWLAGEYAALRHWVQTQTPVFAVCLGAQTLAHALGATVTRAAPLVGFYQTTLTREGMSDPVLGALPRQFHAFNANQHTAGLPSGGVALAVGPCLQAYRVGPTTWAVQFHPEVRRDQVLAWFRDQPDPAVPLPELARQLDERLPAWQQLGRRLAAAFLAAAQRTASRRAGNAAAEDPSPDARSGRAGLSTVCVHGDEELDAQGGMHVPLYNHSTFGFGSTRALLDVVEGRKDGNLYTRYGLNPTIRAIERRLAMIDGGELAYVFGAGMAAEAATFLTHCGAGDHIVCIGDVYGGTYQLLTDNLHRLGIRTTFLLVSETGRLGEALTPQTRLVFFENPTNPNLDVIDIPAVTEIARTRGVLTVVDATFASPVNQRPLELGADLVIHATTKYLGGHSDITGGVVIGPKALVEPIWTWRKNLGQVMAPEVAYLLGRSLRTLVIRVRQQNATAQAVAEFLQSHPRIVKVNYPGLPGSPAHAVAKDQMQGFGGMLSFVYDGDAAATAAVVDRLRLFTIAPSLGGAESLVCQPVTLTHHGIDPAERARRGIVDGMIRVSCGLEDAGDLIADFEQALNPGHASAARTPRAADTARADDPARGGGEADVR